MAQKLPSKIECTVVDAGARYGLHPSWQSVDRLAAFHLFETDHDEVARLQRKYADHANITVHHAALYHTDTTLTFNIRRHRALNSLYEVNEDLDYLIEEQAKLGSYDVAAHTIDGMFANDPVHFLKLDVEGAEIDVLEGARRALAKTVLGVRSEVFFARILNSAASFGAIHAFMTNAGYELINLDYDGRGAAKSPFTRTNRFGKLMSSDGVWAVTTDRLFDPARPDRERDVVRLAMFLMLNSASDVALDILLRAVNEAGLRFAGFHGDPLFDRLHRDIAHLFKDISYLPSMEMKVLNEAYETVFEHPFPTLNEFYESDFLN
tara:strand:+ start:23213 stop:24175 length:963 start_codon:yes stop_codon:yes gene_type:complete